MYKTKLGVFFVSLALATAMQAAVIVRSGVLSGAAEAPPTGSLGTGTALVTVETDTNLMRVQVTFSGLVNTAPAGQTPGVTAAHIHCCLMSGGPSNVGVATTTPTFPGFPLGVLSGTYDMTFDLRVASTYNPAFITAQGGLAQAEAALINGLTNYQTYLNIHTAQFPGGEIRAFLTPEPATTGLLGASLAGLLIGRKRVRR